MFSNKHPWMSQPVISISIIIGSGMLYVLGVIVHAPSICLISWALAALGFLLAW